MLILKQYSCNIKRSCFHFADIDCHDHEVIGYEFGQQLYAAAKEPKSFWTIPGATHNDLHVVGRLEFPSRLASFYKTLRR